MNKANCSEGTAQSRTHPRLRDVVTTRLKQHQQQEDETNSPDGENHNAAAADGGRRKSLHDKVAHTIGNQTVSDHSIALAGDVRDVSVNYYGSSTNRKG